MFVILWEFEVKHGCEAAFRKAYGPEGDWAALFRRHPRYRKTRLLQDSSDPHLYYSLDVWESENDHLHFLDANGEEYVSLDRATEGLTERERRIGAFETDAEPALGSGKPTD